MANVAYLVACGEVLLELLEGPLEVQAPRGVAVVHPVVHGAEHEGQPPLICVWGFKTAVSSRGEGEGGGGVAINNSSETVASASEEAAQ